MENWLLMQTFYHGLTTSTRETMDAVAGCAFLPLTIRDATTLAEKMASNLGWNEEWTYIRKRGGVHQLKEVDMMSAKMDLLIKRLDDWAREKKEIMYIYDSRMTCEECGGNEYSGHNYLEIQEDMNYINNNTNYHP
jgi:hypothetical protein